MLSSESLLERTLAHRQSGLPFVIYRVPGHGLLKGIFQQPPEVYTTENFSDEGFVFAPFSKDDAAVIIPDSKSELLTAEWIQPEDTGVSVSEGIKIDSSNKATYVKKVAKAIEAIRKNEFAKLVLSRYSDYNLKVDKLFSFQNLLASHSNALVYWFFHPGIGEWMGATPELLLSLSDGIMETVSLAGTRTAGNRNRTDWTSKEINEQQFVTDFILEKIQPITTEINVSEKETVRAGDLYHLQTRIKANLTNHPDSLKAIISALHPTPAVCGLPQQEALNYIRHNEAYDRKFYTGFLGELNMDNSGSGQLYVNLRCMELFHNGIRIYVGGGITAESDPGEEWLETVNKSKTMLNAIAFSAS